MKRIKYLVLALLVLLPAFSTAGLGKVLPKSDKMLSVVNKEFEIYAPRQADLEHASEAIIHARRVYQKYFGKDAPKIALVLFDTPDQAAAYEKSKFNERGMALLKWNALSAPSPLSVNPELGIVFAQLPGENRAQVLGVFDDQPPAGIKLQKGDVFLAVNNQTIAKFEDFARAIVEPTDDSNVTLRVKREGREIDLEFARSRRSPPDASTIAKIQNVIQNSKIIPTGKQVIAHEVMHTLMQAGLKTYKIPAWYSEGLASLAEFPDDLKQRRLRMKENVQDASPIAALLTMQHPANRGQAAPSVQKAGATASGGPVTIVASGVTKAEGLMYEQSMTLLEYLAETEGNVFVGRIGESLARGESMESVLKTAGKAPTDIAQLDVAWAKWLSQQ